jgi:hypothetical protein
MAHQSVRPLSASRAGEARRRRSARHLIAIAAVAGASLAGAAPASTALAAGRAHAAVPAWSRAVAIKLPADADGISELQAVACAHTGFCGAGGSYQNNGVVPQAIVVTGSSGTWTTAKVLRLPGTAVPGIPGSNVLGMACVSASSCVAVGYFAYSLSVSNAAPFIARKTGSTWGRAIAVRLPSDSATGTSSNAELSAVTCSSASACTAVGQYRNQSGSTVPMAVTSMTGGRWKPAVRLPEPATAQHHHGAVDPAGLACRRPGDCEVVGEFGNSHGVNQSWHLSETGGRWGRASVLQGPPSFPSIVVSGLGCPAIGTCETVGDYTKPPGRAVFGAAESHGRWARAAQITALPHGADNPALPDLQDVSCPLATGCIAVGSYGAGGVSVPLVLAHSSGSWHAGSVAQPASASGAQGELTAVACWTAGHCVSVGFFVTTMVQVRPMAAVSH